MNDIQLNEDLAILIDRIIICHNLKEFENYVTLLEELESRCTKDTFNMFYHYIRSQCK